ncbi:MAG: hypothetical protein GY903_21555 [Fuerstiella sp.]|nr:hypothetical protein [Fuerstiella sp.]MCP4857078.1 hypothetical protein [Fuerstiella sp.]
MYGPFVESLPTSTTTPSRPRPLPAIFLHVLVTPATNLVHFEEQLATAFTFLRCQWSLLGVTVLRSARQAEEARVRAQLAREMAVITSLKAQGEMMHQKEGEPESADK